MKKYILTIGEYCEEVMEDPTTLQEEIDSLIVLSKLMGYEVDIWRTMVPPNNPYSYVISGDKDHLIEYFLMFKISYYSNGIMLVSIKKDNDIVKVYGLNNFAQYIKKFTMEIGKDGEDYS